MVPPDLSQPFTVGELARVGLTRASLRTLLRRGRVRRVVRGVYAAVELGDGIELRARAVALALGHAHVACDRTAAWLYGIDLYTAAEHDRGLVVEMCVGPSSQASHRAGVDGHQRDLAHAEVTQIWGVPVTTPLRTALDLACILERRDAMAALDAFRRHHDLSLLSLTMTLDQRFKGRRGVVQARDLIPRSDPRAESIRESWVRITVLDHGLPSPEPQVWVVDAGVPIYRIDLAYRGSRIAIEYNGVDAHEATPEQLEADEERHAWLRTHGWTVVVVRNGDFTGRRLDRWLEEIRVALRPSYSNRRRLERGARSAESVVAVDPKATFG